MKKLFLFCSLFAAALNAANSNLGMYPNQSIHRLDEDSFFHKSIKEIAESDQKFKEIGVDAIIQMFNSLPPPYLENDNLKTIDDIREKYYTSLDEMLRYATLFTCDAETSQIIKMSPDTFSKCSDNNAFNTSYNLLIASNDEVIYNIGDLNIYHLLQLATFSYKNLQNKLSTRENKANAMYAVRKFIFKLISDNNTTNGGCYNGYMNRLGQIVFFLNEESFIDAIIEEFKSNPKTYDIEDNYTQQKEIEDFENIYNPFKYLEQREPLVREVIKPINKFAIVSGITTSIGIAIYYTRKILKQYFNWFPF